MAHLFFVNSNFTQLYGLNLYWRPSKYVILKKWIRLKYKIRQGDASRTQLAINQIKKILYSTDVNLFHSITGWAHWDLWLENILFDSTKVVSILDFDRLKYVFPDLGIARPIISFALSKDGKLNMSLVDAFIKGYGEYRPLTKYNLINGLKLLWYKESPWWLIYPEEFFNELWWISCHWNELEDIFDF